MDISLRALFSPFLDMRWVDGRYRICDLVSNLERLFLCLSLEIDENGVYLTHMFMAKKRYVGFRYETSDEVEPALGSKGMKQCDATGVPAQAKMTQTCLKFVGVYGKPAFSPRNSSSAFQDSVQYSRSGRGQE